MEYLIHLAIMFGLYAILAVSLNLVAGYTGLLSVTHAAFYGIGAYAVAMLMVDGGWGFAPSLALAVVVSAGVGLFIGSVLSRFRDDYYVLASVGFNVIMYSIFLNWQSVTRGPLGIPGIPRPEIGGIPVTTGISFLILVALCALIVYGIAWWLTTSSFGRALKAIREDEQALQVFGYKTQHFKLVIFVIAAALAAVAGGLFATYISFIDPSTFTVDEAIFILAIVVLGGLSNISGSLAGALFLVFLPEALRFVGFPTDIAAQMRQMVYGVLLILLMLYRPQGLMGEYKL